MEDLLPLYTAICSPVIFRKSQQSASFYLLWFLSYDDESGIVHSIVNFYTENVHSV